MSSRAIGIDLGTTYSCVGVWEDGRSEIIANDQGNRTTPSCVSFSDTERLIGEAAHYQMAMNPTNTIFSAKRLIGRCFDDREVQSDTKLWPFEVVNKHNKPTFKVNYKGKVRFFTPEEISSMVLIKMKKTAEAYLGKKVSDAVITVPAYFNDSQRRATKDAGTIAGLNILQIISEPTAAAIAYGLKKNITQKRFVLVFDLGGGTFDVSLLSIENNVFDVKATAGDNHLGGEDFDNRLVDYFAKEFKFKYMMDITNDPRSMRRLRSASERAKRTLSSATQTTIEIFSLFGGIDFFCSITRARFEEICRDLFQSVIFPIQEVINCSKIDKAAIDDVVLVGGSTHIPKIQKLVSDFFDKKVLKKTVNPDEAVAFGAAAQAAILNKDVHKDTLNLTLFDVTPLSLGIKINGELMQNIIDRNTTIPTKKADLFFTSVDNQSEAEICVFEGERAFTKDNILLASFILIDIPPALRRIQKINITFEIDINGIICVTACILSTKRSQKIVIVNNRGHLLKHEIDRMISEAEFFALEDQAAAALVKEKHNLEDYIYSLNNYFLGQTVFLKLDPSSEDWLKKSFQNSLSWLHKSSNATQIEFRIQHEKLASIAESIFRLHLNKYPYRRT